MKYLQSEMDLDISAGEIDGTHRIGVPTKGKNRPIIIKLDIWTGGAYLPTKRD